MAGLLSSFNNPFKSGGLLSDPMVRLQMGAAMMGGQTLGEQLGGGLQAAGMAGIDRRKKQEEEAKINQTYEWLKTQNPELAEAFKVGALDAGSAMKMHYEAKQPEKPDWINAGDGRFYSPSLDETRFVDSDPNAPPPVVDYGNTPIPMYDENNRYTVGQLGSDNTASPVKLPPGFRVGDPYEKAYQTSQGAAVGKDQGETVATYESVNSKMPGLEKVITELNDVAEDATYTVGGNVWNETRKQLGLGPSAGAIARTKYMAMVNNQVLPMLKDTFGAAFTVSEGDALRATLGDPDKTPEEKQMVLEAFIEQKRRDVDALAARTGNAPYMLPNGAPPLQGGNQRRTANGITWGP